MKTQTDDEVAEKLKELTNAFKNPDDKVFAILGFVVSFLETLKFQKVAKVIEQTIFQKWNKK